MNDRQTRQLMALHRGTRQAHAQTFLRCTTYMITMLDELRREEQIEEGKPLTLGAFGLRFTLMK
jgi:hypothetical protein